MELRRSLRDLNGAKDAMGEMDEREKDTIWNKYHLGVINALSGSTDEAILSLSKVMEDPDDREWAQRLKSHTGEILSELRATGDARGLIMNNISKERRLKKLDEVDISFSGAA